MNVLPEVMPALVAPVGGTQSRSSGAAWTPANPLEQPGWDAMVAGHPSATFFHGSAWARVLHGTYGHAPVYLVRSSGGQLEQLLPLMEVRSVVTGRRGVSLPFTDCCPPLMTGNRSARELFAAALELGRERRWKSLEVRGGVGRVLEAPPSLAFYEHTIKLDAPEAALLARTESAVRRGIRKSEQSGLRVQIGQDLAAVRRYFELHCRTRRRHGLPPQPFRFFENIARHVLANGSGRVVLVEHAGQSIAGGIFFQFGDRAIYKFGASDYAFQQYRPNNLMMWEAIKWHAAHGCKSLHLGRTSLANDGLRRFKLGFGAQEEKMEYCRYDFSRAAFVTDVDRVEGWHNAVFRRLPEPLLRWAGAGLYPHLS